MKGFSRVLQKLHRYFNGTIISTFFVPLLPVWPVDFSLRLKDSELALASVKSVIAPSSFKNQMFLNNYNSIKLYIGMTVSIY